MVPLSIAFLFVLTHSVTSDLRNTFADDYISPAHCKFDNKLPFVGITFEKEAEFFPFKFFTSSMRINELQDWLFFDTLRSLSKLLCTNHLLSRVLTLFVRAFKSLSDLSNLLPIVPADFTAEAASFRVLAISSFSFVTCFCNASTDS